MNIPGYCRVTHENFYLALYLKYKKSLNPLYRPRITFTSHLLWILLFKKRGALPDLPTMSSQLHAIEPAPANKILNSRQSQDYDTKTRESFQASNDRLSPMLNYTTEGNAFTRYR